MIIRKPVGRPHSATPEAMQNWGRGNTILDYAARYEHLPHHASALSIKAVCHGRQSYECGNRMFGVDEDVYLIINEGRDYGSRIDSDEEVHCFAIYFRPELAYDVLGSLKARGDQILDDPRQRSDQPVNFLEQLHPHDRTVSPVLRYIERICASGFDDEDWYEEQLILLLERMLQRHRLVLKEIEALSALRRSTREEIYRRVHRAVDFIHSCYEQSITIKDMATVACLSEYHFLRLFKEAFGTTPRQYLLRKRVRAAARLLENTDVPIAEIAVRVGFDSRQNFYRSFQKAKRSAPRTYRKSPGRSGFSTGIYAAKMARVPTV